MNNTIEILDRDTNTKQVYILQEDKVTQSEFDKEVLVEILKVLIKVSKFSLYIAISFLEMFLNVLKVIFNLTDYSPFKGLTEGLIATREDRLDKRAREKVSKERTKFASEYLCRHEFVFPRSDEYLNTYREIQSRLQNFSEHNIELTTELYRDTMKQISILVVEAEKQALKQGYQYARDTKYKIDVSEAYDEYIQSKVMQGESNRKYRAEGEA